MHLDNRNACAKRSWFIKDIVLLNSYNAIIFQLKGMKALHSIEHHYVVRSRKLKRGEKLVEAEVTSNLLFHLITHQIAPTSKLIEQEGGKLSQATVHKVGQRESWLLL